MEILSPSKFIKYAENRKALPKTPPPKTVIFTFHPGILNTLKKKVECDRSSGIFSHLYYIRDNKDMALFSCKGIGSPIAATHAEELFAWGVQNIIIFGTAGCLDENLAIGNICICEKALIKEGTSPHYQNEIESFPSEDLVSTLETKFTEAKLDFRKSVTVTTDAPYRETEKFIQEAKSNGATLVEMETSAIFSVAAHRVKQAAAVLSVSDHLSFEEWSPNFHAPQIIENLVKGIMSLID